MGVLLMVVRRVGVGWSRGLVIVGVLGWGMVEGGGQARERGRTGAMRKARPAASIDRPNTHTHNPHTQTRTL